MEIRPLGHDEAAKVVEECWQPLAEEMETLDPANELAPDAREEAIAYQREQLQKDGVVTFVAVEDGEFAGFVKGSARDPPPIFARGTECYVEDVYVRPEFRREGLAGALMDRMESWALERECERMSLDVNAANEAAISLYEDRGYEIRRHRMTRSL